MSIESKRLESLIEFAQQAARLRIKPVTDVARHQIFHKFESDFSGLPGVHISSLNEEDKNEVWLTINRLQESNPPIPTSNLLRVWLEISKNPLKEPFLRSQIQENDLEKAVGNISSSPIDPCQTISLHSFSQRDELQKLLKTYLESEWKPWTIAEKQRRRAISIYSGLFSLRQQLVDGVASAPLELIFGIGMAFWNVSGNKVCYPLITKVVEISLNPINMDIEISPCELAPRVEVDLYSFLDNQGIPDLDKKIKEFSEQLSQSFSPFDHTSYEGILRSVATHLDPAGIYISSKESSEDAFAMEVSEKLQVTNNWVLFARPRSLNVFIQDLECFKNFLKEAEEDLSLPPALASLVTNPSNNLESDLSLPTFRGLSDAIESNSNSQAFQNLYFPKPFNDEQVRIVQLLEANDGVVVQGPPGTGKTHTIANIICHYLATGKRVLVTSMKEPALAVLREQLPKELQPLVISLLSEEQGGMKQLEYAVSRIAAEIQSTDKHGLSKDIQKFEGDIDSIHANLANIDRQVKEWAIQNLSPIRLENEIILPVDAAKEVIEGLELIEWFQDYISIESKHNFQFSDSDVLKLRDARRILGVDLSYLDSCLPLANNIPTAQIIGNLHHDLVNLTTLQQALTMEHSKLILHIKPEMLELAQQCLLKIKAQLVSIRKLRNFNFSWVDNLVKRTEQNNEDDFLKLFQILGEEFIAVFDERKKFLNRPLAVLESIDKQPKLIQAIENLSKNKRPFGFLSTLLETDAKKLLLDIRIGGEIPTSPKDWLYVLDYILRLKKIRELFLRWNALAEDLTLPTYIIDPLHISEVVKLFEVYREIKIAVENAQELAQNVKEIVSSFEETPSMWMNESILEDFEETFKNHLDLYKLNSAISHREKISHVLKENSGLVISNMQNFLDTVLGNSSYSNEFVKNQWNIFLEELERVQKLVPTLNTVLDICDLIKASGASLWAEQLSSIPATTVDELLPTNWSKIWRLRRLATYLSAIDARGELRRLKKNREELEQDLRRIYGITVEKRVWLKIIENATPSIRSALAAYVSAILKIGKDKGKRAPRYRNEARNAAALAFPAIPCWIMPHHRVSQSLPAEFGCFDLVIIDEASQSDLSALPCMLRAQKVLIVGDDKQVSPEGIGIEEEEVQRLMTHFLSEQVDLFKPFMTPECSIYDLFKVVFAKSAVMLKEHFRSVAPIIEYSKREFYNHELKPLRIAKSLERLDPPLIDILIEDGFRKGNTNPAEIRCIVEEIKAIVQDPKMTTRSIGVVSLLGDQQACEIWKSLEDEIGLDAIQRHQIACGDALTFQGKERDIMFLSMVVCPKTATAITRRGFAQRFNVAASRARDRMYLVRSVSLPDLSEADYLRRRLIEHFSAPFAQDEVRVNDLKELCESPFESEIYDLLTERGYHVTPQLPVGGFRLDMVVEGTDGKRLAIECDGDRYHGPDQWENDMRRQRILERAGWRFWRCFASTFVLQRKAVVHDLISTLESLEIRPMDSTSGKGSLHTEARRYNAFANIVEPDSNRA